MSQKSGAHFTQKQGHYLAFIYTYAHMFGRPPAETDMQRHFRVSPPSVPQMIVALERNGFIRRQPGVPRSIEILVPLESLPILEWLGINKITSYRPKLVTRKSGRRHIVGVLDASTSPAKERYAVSGERIGRTGEAK